MKDEAPASVDDYIAGCAAKARPILEEIRRVIAAEVPEAVEAISYGMPAFKLNGKVLVYYAAWKRHIGFYATPGGNAAFAKELARYEGAKGSVKFPFDEDMPWDLIRRIAAFRAAETPKASRRR